MYDVIVVGARCGGAATAMLLARRGHRVLLVDRARFPSDMRLSTHLVWPGGVARLKRWGLLDALAATGCPPLAEAVFDVGPFALRGGFPPVEGVDVAYVPRRRVLDGLLVEAAVAAGAELWEGVTVEGLLADGGAVTGIRARSGGRSVTAQAQVVIGADGMRSRVGELVDAPRYRHRPAVQGSYWSYWSGIGSEWALYPRDGLTAYAFPTHDGLTLVGVNWSIDRWRAVRADIAGEHFRAVAEADPALADRLAAGRREERWVGAATPGFFRKPFGPGWALVGDAGYTKDPCTAQGISDAFSQAELLAEAVHDGLVGRRPLAAALADYQHRRDTAALPMYEFTCEMARMQPPTPEKAAMLAALSGDRAATERFFGVFAGSVSVAEFFGAATAAA
jgi:flavin-dependent dehydrogenase